MNRQGLKFAPYYWRLVSRYKLAWVSAALVILFVFIILFPGRISIFLLRHDIPDRIAYAFWRHDSRTLTYMGWRHMGGGGTYDLRLAEKLLKEALANDPRAPLANYFLARIAFLERRTYDALRYTEKEQEISTDFWRLHYLRGLVYGYSGQYPKAEREFRTYLDHYQDGWAGYVDLSWIYFRQGKYQEMKELLEPVVRRKKNAWLMNAYGVALLNTGEAEGARKALLEAEEFVARMTPELWGEAYNGNDPRVYATGLASMRQVIETNLDIANSQLSGIRL